MPTQITSLIVVGVIVAGVTVAIIGAGVVMARSISRGEICGKSNEHHASYKVRQQKHHKTHATTRRVNNIEMKTVNTTVHNMS